MEQAEIIDTFWTYQWPKLVLPFAKRVCASVDDFQTTRASGDMVSLLVESWKLGGCPHSLGN